MKTKIMTSVVAGLLLACAGLANAAEPIALTDSQMDSVAAGTAVAVAFASASATSFPPFGFHHHHHHHHHHFFVPFFGVRAVAFAAAGTI